MRRSTVLSLPFQLVFPAHTYVLIRTMDIILKVDWLVAHTACLVCLVCTVSGCRKNAPGRPCASSWHITKLEQSTLLRYLWSWQWNLCCATTYSDIGICFNFWELKWSEKPRQLETMRPACKKSEWYHSKFCFRN